MENQIYSSKGWKHVLWIVIPFILKIAIFQSVGSFVAGLDIRNLPSQTTDEQSLIIVVFDLIGTVLLIWLFVKYVDKKDFVWLGFYKSHVLKDTIIGILIGFVIMALGLALLIFNHQITIKSVDFSFSGLSLTIALFVCVAIGEELLVRGYILNNLMASFNKYVALVLSSTLFAAMHLLNPNVDILSMVGLFVAGLLLGLCYVLTKNLWLPIALHFSWNFFQSLLGFNVSGQDFYSLITTSFQRANDYNGGAFGFEGSILSIPFQVTAMVYIFAKFGNRVSKAEVDVEN